VQFLPRSEGRGFDGVHVLLPLIAQLFLLSFECACVPADWKVAKIAPLYKQGPCILKSKIPDTQFGFHPSRNTLQPMFLRHLQHAAHTIKPSNYSRLHTAFIDFKKAYNTVSSLQTTAGVK